MYSIARQLHYPAEPERRQRRQYLGALRGRDPRQGPDPGRSADRYRQRFEKSRDRAASGGRAGRSTDLANQRAGRSELPGPLSR